jgi:hypothetical protein
MQIKFTRKLVVGTSVIAAMGAAGGAYAATQSGNPRQAYLNDLAKRLNVSPQTLQSAMKNAFLDQLNAAVAAGRLTQAQANAIKQRIEHGAAGGPLPFTPGGIHGGGFGGPGVAGLRGALGTVASYLGLSQTQLLNDLRSGKSLAQIAGTQHKSVSGLESTITSAIKSDLDKAVSQKRITSSEENQILSTLRANIGAIVTGTGHGLRMFHGFHGPPGWSHGAGSSSGNVPPAGYGPPAGGAGPPPAGLFPGA